MKFRGLILSAVATLAVLPVVAQQTQKFTAAKHNEYGLTYNLPTTHLKVVVEAEKTVKKVGPYYKYAKKYLGTTDVIREDSQEWNIKGVDVSTYGTPDSRKEYLMQFKAGNPVYVMKSEDGLLLSINTENVQEPEQVKVGMEQEVSVLDDNAYGKALPGELLVSESTAKRAEIAAQQIYKIRESRTNFVTGEADEMPDGEALKLIIQQLDEQEKMLTALFLGTTQKSTIVKIFDYVPDTLEFKNNVLLRVSDFKGLVDSSDLSGEPLYISMKIVERGELPVDEKGVTKRLPKGAVMYTKPGKAQFTFMYNGEKMAENTFDVAQLGVEFGLDPKLFNSKKAPSYVKFYPSTGSIAEIGEAAVVEEEKK